MSTFIRPFSVFAVPKLSPATLQQFWRQQFGRQPRQQPISVLLAVAGAVPGLPLTGLHKLYLGQPLWGVLYLSLFFTPIPHIASGLEAVWYLLQPRSQFDERFNAGVAMELSPTPSQGSKLDPQQVSAIATALQQLEQLRQAGLLSEYEFEQKRRQLVD